MGPIGLSNGLETGNQSIVSFFYLGNLFISDETWDHLFLLFGKLIFGNLIGELVLKLVVLWRAFNSRPSPHSRTGNISMGWISSHYFYPVMLLSFINERDVLLSDWEYIHGLDILYCFYPVMLLPSFH